MRCPKCNFENKNNTVCCSKCGHELNTVNQSSDTKDKKKKTALIVYLVVLTLLIAVLSNPVTTILGVILILLPFILRKKKEKEYIDTLKNDLEKQKENLDLCQREKKDLEEQAEKLGFKEYTQTKAEVDKLNGEIATLNSEVVNHQNRITGLKEDYEKSLKQLKTATNKLNKSKELYRAIDYSINTYFGYVPTFEQCKLPESIVSDLEELAPTVTLKLHCMDMRELRKAFNDNKKEIEKVKEQYRGRYTTKVNQALYDLIVVALDSELQNVLTSLKYEKLDVGIDSIKNMTSKYLEMVSKANQNMVGTLSAFIGTMEYLYINAVKIEYNYYVKKEQARQEQIAIREQMRQEAKERKELELQKAKFEAEEEKYRNEISSVEAQMQSASADEVSALEAKIAELKAQMSDMIIKKDEIVKLQNGKAGNIYVISNLGSFGENMFKIGMTRRLNPQERVDELGSASVPFEFDVHCFIFSNNAVELESQIHTQLNDKRVNKVNLRKEFFYSNVDELEALVHQIDPTAEFTKTMAAEDYRQSISSEAVYSTDYMSDDNEDDEQG